MLGLIQHDGMRPCGLVLRAGLMVALLTLPGCRGCRSEDPQAKAQREAEELKLREEQEKDKRDFEVGQPILLPGHAGLPLLYAKPGHWATVAQQIEANHNDFVGRYTSRIADRQRGVPISYTSFLLRSTRPVVLTKGRPKAIDSLLFVPAVDRPIQLGSSISERRSGAQVVRNPEIPINKMQPYEYSFVVLATEPERYSFLKSVDSVVVPFAGTEEFDDFDDTLHYRVLQPDATTHVPLADNALVWTSIAYVLWDEIDPELLTPEQQTALIDWLHWGGQLIVNGPDSLDLLAGSFLDPYLPAYSTGSREITTDDLRPLSDNWLVRSGKAPRKPLAPIRPWSGVVLELAKDGRPLPGTGELLVERDVGRGRVVASAMQLSERELINWNPHFQSWLNACVLRRPHRVYRSSFALGANLFWADPKLRPRRLDARLMSGLRYWARDFGTDTNYQPPVDAEIVAAAPAATPPAKPVPPEQAGGVGAWNDFSKVADGARDVLREAAGVEVPGASFVVWCVAGYLLVLVPLNWLLFQALGRVEWAWLAAPLIALAGTWFVVNQAQLDIGFVRAQTEVAILELQPDHSRGHLTRYTALYTSLATTYDFEFDNLTTLAAPFASGRDFAMLRGERRTSVDISRHDSVRLAGLQVASNATDMVHSEQMFVLDGPIRLGTSSRGHLQIENQSQLDLTDVAILKRIEGVIEESPGLSGVWIGELAGGATRPVVLSTIPLVAGQLPFANQRASAVTESADRLDLTPLLQMASLPPFLDQGETRLVARIDGVLPGEAITPAASQVRGATLVVAHLGYGPRSAPRPDLNAAVDVLKELPEEDDF